MAVEKDSACLCMDLWFVILLSACVLLGLWVGRKGLRVALVDVRSPTEGLRCGRTVLDLLWSASANGSEDLLLSCDVLLVLAVSSDDAEVELLDIEPRPFTITNGLTHGRFRGLIDVSEDSLSSSISSSALSFGSNAGVLYIRRMRGLGIGGGCGKADSISSYNDEQLSLKGGNRSDWDSRLVMLS